MESGEVFYYLNKTSSNIYVRFSEQIPIKYRFIINILLYTILIVIYSVFVWKFYKFLARRDILKLNLNQYNRTDHPVLNKFVATLFFLLEYIIILPILVFFWFAILATFLLLLSKSQSIEQIILISAAIVAAVRMTSYISNDLSKDLAKMFPFTVLAIFLLEPDFFKFTELIVRISEIPSLFNNILIYLVFIIAVEIILRTLFLIIDLISPSQDSKNLLFL